MAPWVPPASTGGSPSAFGKGTHERQRELPALQYHGAVGLRGGCTDRGAVGSVRRAADRDLPAGRHETRHAGKARRCGGTSVVAERCELRRRGGNRGGEGA